MRILLDTHVSLWFYLGDTTRLTSHALAVVLDPIHIKLVSPASFWEIAIKLSVEKYALHVSDETFIQEAIFANGFEILPIAPSHAAAIIPMPFYHKDPFDRLLIGQAITEGISIVSSDDVFDRYGVDRIW